MHAGFVTLGQLSFLCCSSFSCQQFEQEYLHAGFHDLAVVVDGPHAHHALLTPTDDTGAVRGAADGSHSPLVRIVDGVQQLPTLRPKSTDLAITPATDDTLPILHSCRACQCCAVVEKEHSLTLCGAKLLLS